MRRSEDFDRAIRSLRHGRRTVVVHLARDGEGARGSVRGDGAATSDDALVGFIVSRAVGGAVTRNLVKRRLREILRSHRDVLPAGSRIVVRALPAAATASYDQLERDVVGALHSLLARSAGRGR